MLNGYDIDGTLTAGVKPEDPYVVISGKSKAEHNNDPLIEELEKKSPVYLRTSDYAKGATGSAAFKVAMIKEHGVTAFYENNVSEAVAIQIAVPRCAVHLVGDIEDSPYG